MFEDRTYEYIMSELINKVPVDVSTEEGSIIQSALSPLAYELEKLYIEFDVLLSQTFVETADYDYLEKRAAERGLTPIAATYCQSLGIFCACRNKLLCSHINHCQSFNVNYL